MEKISQFDLGYYLGPRFESSKIELYIYDGTDEADRMEVSKNIKMLMPEDVHGVTSYCAWRNMYCPTIKIFIDSTTDPMCRTFLTIPHEMQHALGKGVYRRCQEFKMEDVLPGSEIMARMAGACIGQFQKKYLKTLGYNVVKEDL